MAVTLTAQLGADMASAQMTSSASPPEAAVTSARPQVAASSIRQAEEQESEAKPGDATKASRFTATGR
jgi:hypothetical protein